MDLEEKLEKTLEYLYFMAEKYADLNRKTNNKYNWRYNGICERIAALEELKDNSTIESYNECYNEDLKESKIK